MAGRIPQSFIDDLLARVDIVDVVNTRVPLKKAGKNYQACCPFHQEKTPSFSVNGDDQFYYCFGCGAGGNAIGFLMEYERMEFPQAVEQLAGSIGIEVPRDGDDENSREASKKRQDIFSVLQASADYYHQELRNAPTAINYLKGRGITGTTARDFMIGYAPQGWDNLLKKLGKDDEAKNLLLEGGMIIQKEEEGKVYDRFRHRVIFPIRNRGGKVIAFGGRVLDDSKPKYLNSPETEVFHKSQELYGFYEARKTVRHLEKFIVVEGYMDVVMLAQHGIRYGVATLGTSIGEAHLRKLFRAVSEVVFCFDGDAAGRAAANRALQAALPQMEDGRQARFLFLPEGEDPDSLVQKIGAEKFESLVNSATPLSEYLFEAALEGEPADSPEGASRLTKKALPMIRKLPVSVFRELMMKSLAEKAGLEIETLARVTEEPAPPEPDDFPPPPAYDDYGDFGDELPPAGAGKLAPRQPTRSASNKMQMKITPARSAIATLLQHPEMAAAIDDISPLKGGQNSDIQLLVELIELIQGSQEVTTGLLIGHWVGTDQKELVVQLAGEEIPVGEGLQQQLLETLESLKSQTDESWVEKKAIELAENKGRNYIDLSNAEKDLYRALARKQDK